MRPRVGWRNLVSRLKQVVLPAPFGPISAWMVPRATRSETPLTAVKPAKSLVRSSVSRMASPLTATDVPSPGSLFAVHRGIRPYPRRDRDGSRTGTIAARRSQYDLGGSLARIVAADRAEWGGPKRGARPAVGGLPGGGVGWRRGVEGGARASIRSGGQQCADNHMSGARDKRFTAVQ